MPALKVGDILRPKGEGTEICRVTGIEYSDALHQNIIKLSNLHDKSRTTSCPADMVEMLYKIEQSTEMSELL